MSATFTDGTYAWSAAQATRLRNHPRVSGSFAMDKGLWDGREVAVIAIERGNARRATQRKIAYGTLVLDCGSTDHIGVRLADGTVTLIHRTRAADVFDMTRRTAR